MLKREWNNRLETGIEEIDKQHMTLFSRINKLELAIYEGKGAKELSQLMDYLELYVDEHLEAEEKVMLDVNYPGFAKHAHQHNEFRTYFNELLSSCQDREPDSYLAIKVDRELRKWWENHILKIDIEYVPYVKKR